MKTSLLPTAHYMPKTAYYNPIKFGTGGLHHNLSWKFNFGLCW